MMAQCNACEASRKNAKAHGHRDWSSGVCFDHAGISWEAFMAELPEEQRSEVMRLASGIVIAPAQLDLFGAAA